MALNRQRVTRQLDRVGDLLTTDAAARELNLTYTMLDQLIRRRNIPTYGLGTTRLVRLNDIRPHLNPAR